MKKDILYSGRSGFPERVLEHPSSELPCSERALWQGFGREMHSAESMTASHVFICLKEYKSETVFKHTDVLKLPKLPSFLTTVL